MKRSLLAAACLILASHADAGEFTVSAFGQGLGTPMGKAIAEVVSSEFTAAFPNDRYEIVVIYHHSQIGDDNVCYAMAGVARKPKETGSPASVPAWIFNSTRIDKNTGAWNVAKVRECLSKTVRDAVQNMMSIPAKELKDKSDL